MMAAPRRLAAAFRAQPGKTGLIPFVTAGYPSLDGSLEILRGFSRLGVLAVEIGIPFSDPIADGPEIQRASECALRQGVDGDATLRLVERFREESELPVVIMTYANPVVRHGAERFARTAAGSGVDGVIVSDLPPDESPDVWRALDDARLDTILLVAPTTPESRLGPVLERSRGFVYCLSRTGVTGRGEGYAGSVPERVAVLRARTSLPIAMGFGIRSADHVRSLNGVVDAVVVGAAFMRTVTEDPRKGAVERVLALAEELQSPLRE